MYFSFSSEDMIFFFFALQISMASEFLWNALIRVILCILADESSSSKLLFSPKSPMSSVHFS